MEGKSQYRTTRRCAWCGRSLPPLKRSGAGGRNRRYCSNSCRQAAYRDRRRKRRNAGR